ncbi:MAG: Ig-like domain-containing protein [Clostridiales bacterium]|nr:Ig-like domain-containing protein [Clostridiales bacterium]
MKNLLFANKRHEPLIITSLMTVITAILLGVSTSIVIGNNVVMAAQVDTVEENSAEKELKIMKNPPEVTIYRESIANSPYKLHPVQINGETNPIYTSYNSILVSNINNMSGVSGFVNGEPKGLDSYAIEFTTDCQDFVFHSSAFFRISVDEGNGYELVSYEGFTDEPYKWLNFKVEFSEKKKRNIKIELMLPFWGVYLRETDTISKLERESNPKAYFIGTSITQCIYKYSKQANSILGYPNTVSHILGFECMNNGIGGTGYLTAGSATTFYDRLVYAVEEVKPDILFIEGGPNDVDRYSNDDIAAEAERCHAYLKEKAPDTKVIIIGLYHHTGYEYLPQKHVDLDQKLRAVALKYGLPYIDLLTGDTIAGDGTILTEGYVSNPDGKFYITGNGNVADKKENGNADIYVDSDNYHPSVEGYRFLGVQLSSEIEKILDYMDENEEEDSTKTTEETPKQPEKDTPGTENDSQKQPGNDTQETKGDSSNQQDGNENSQPAKVEKITVIAPSKKLAAGKKVKFIADVFPEHASNAAVQWKTSNNKYATVNEKGWVSLKKAGAGKTVTVTATAVDGSGKKASIKIKIMKDAVRGIHVTTSKNTLKVGRSMILKTKVKTTGKNVNKTLKWKSSNPHLATVSKKGKVTARKAGKGKTVTITAVSTDGSNKKASVAIRIK